MSLIDELRKAIKAGKLVPIFNSADMKRAGIEDKNNNISNYDKKNKGDHNTHKTVLLSRRLGSATYYTFDEQLLD